MAITVVQTTPVVAALSTASVAVTFATPPTVGRGVIVAVLWTASGALTTCTDTAGNTYTLATSQVHPSGGVIGVDVWACPAITATATPFTITAAGASAQNRTALALEASGPIAVDQTAGTNGSGFTAGAGPTAALTGTDALLVAALSTAGTPASITVGAVVPPWVQQAEPLSTVSGEIDTLSLGSALGLTPSVTWALGSAHFGAGAIVAFKAGTAPSRRGAFVAGEHTTVTASRAAAFGLDGNTNTHDEEGTFKVFGNVAITGDLEVGGAIPAHATTHEAGGVDPIQLDDLAAPSDNTDLNATTSAHGLLRKLSGLDVQVLRGDGTWGMSPLTSGVFAYVFSTTTTAPPGSQRIRFNAAHPYTAVTTLWADFSSSNSEDLYWGWMRIRVGSLLMVQDKDNHLQYAEFTTTGLPIDHGTYVELPVAWASNGTALAVQGVLVRVTAPAPGGSTAVRRQITLVVDNGASAITTGFKTWTSIPLAGTLKKWRLLADVSGSIVIDVWRDTYANFPPTVADTITASAKPTLSAATKNESSTLTGWTTAFSAGDVFGFNVDSVTTVKKISLTLEFE
jgi:hypothetical protein